MAIEQIRAALSGNEAVATAMRQINPDVVPAYPITPSTEIPQYFSAYVANGQVDTDYVAVESEHSATKATVGAAAAGARAMTATSANGLAYMWEIVYIAASMRLPIVMNVVNRALSGPLNIHCDHSDAMGARDAGWIQLYAEDSQEAYDNAVMAFRIAEHPDVQLPVMCCQDGFVTSHALVDMTMLPDEAVKNFVGKKDWHGGLLDTENPVSMGLIDLQPFYFEHKKQQAEAMKNAEKVILEVANEYAELTGRKYGLYEAYKMDDAEVAIVIMNSTAGTARAAVDEMRANGIKAGMLKLRVFRPFPGEALAKALSGLKALAVLDRADSFNAWGGPVFNEVRSALYGRTNMPVVSRIYGLGGRDTDVNDIKKVFTELDEIVRTGEVKDWYEYLSVRE